MYDFEDDEPQWGVRLNLDPETRVWEIHATGSAAMLLFILLDTSEHSLVTKLIEESKFDRTISGFDIT